MNLFLRKSAEPLRRVTFEKVTQDAACQLLGAIHELGTGRVISQSGPISLALTADFSLMHSQGRHLKFQGGELALIPEQHQIVVSTAACGLGLGISVFDLQENLRLVFHFCHGSSWQSWLEHQVKIGLLREAESASPQIENLCWCDLWPNTNMQPNLSPCNSIHERASEIRNSTVIHTRLMSQGMELHTAIRPTFFDQLSASIRFWDRPRSRVCYADLSRLVPHSNNSEVSLHYEA
jgi:hypothetical protein